MVPKSRSIINSDKIILIWMLGVLQYSKDNDSDELALKQMSFGKALIW